MVEEKWLPVAEPGFEDLYEVSNRGKVRSLPRQTVRGVMGGRVLKPGLHPKGYHGVVLSGRGKRRSVLIHKLVLEAFDRPCPPGLEARHLDGVPTHNFWPDNLCWGTHEENHQDRVEHGTDGKGEQNSNAKLTADDIRAIKANVDGLSQKALGARYGIKQAQVSRITTGKQWAHVA